MFLKFFNSVGFCESSEDSALTVYSSLTASQQSGVLSVVAGNFSAVQTECSRTNICHLKLKRNAKFRYRSALSDKHLQSIFTVGNANLNPN